MRLVMIYCGDTCGFDITYPIEYSSKEDAKRDYQIALNNTREHMKQFRYEKYFEIFGIVFSVNKKIDENPIFLTVDEWFEDCK